MKTMIEESESTIIPCVIGKAAGHTLQPEYAVLAGRVYSASWRIRYGITVNLYCKKHVKLV